MRARLAVLATVASAAMAAPTPAGAQAPVCPPAGGGTSTTLGVTGSMELVRVPTGVGRVRVELRGGHGGKVSESGAGGRGGIAEGSFTVTPGECLRVWVGAYGGAVGGFGFGDGGDRGTTPAATAYDGAGGGGASAVAREAGDALVVAGGGGGGGGNSTNALYTGGRGGDGAGGLGPGTPNGQDGADATNNGTWLAGQLGGKGGAESGSGGGGGTDPQAWAMPFVGAGGGGGGGYRGGKGGQAYIGNFDQTVPPDFTPMGGGGGGGGSSYAATQVSATTFAVGEQACPTGAEAQCDGAVTLTWVEAPTSVVAYEGGGQTATATTTFARRLEARALGSSEALPGVDVTFRLPADAPSGTFEGGGRTATVQTGADGIATSPRIVAGTIAGSWTATATVAGVARPARFALRTAPAATTATIAASATPSASGEPVTFTATVAGAVPSAGIPAGRVGFRVDGRDLGASVALDAFGTTTSAPIALPAGTHAVEIAYAGDATFAPARATFTQQTARAAATVALTSSANPALGGSPVTFQADVATAAPGTGTATGSVQFAVDGVALGAPVALVAGRATSPAYNAAGSPAPDGVHEVTASYAGDAQHTAAGATLSQAVGATSTAVTLTPSATGTVFGQPLAVTARVARAGGPATGAVDVAIDGTITCAAVTLDASGEATCPLPASTEPGTHRVTAHYGGDGGAQPSDGALTVDVQPARSATDLVVVPSPSALGAPLTLQADVDAVAPGAGDPSGSVRFRIDGRTVGTAPLTASGATLSDVPAPSGGPYEAEAIYEGDAGFSGSRAAVIARVNPAPTTITIESSASPSPLGAPVTFTARVEPVAPASGAPGGAVEFRVDGVPRGAPVDLRDGAAVSAPLAGLAAGEHDVRAVYLGTAGALPSEARMVQQVGAQPAPGGGGSGGGPEATALALTVTPNPARPGAVIAIEATLSPAASGGTVAFALDGAPLPGCAAIGPRDGRALCRADTPAAGAHVVTAQWSGTKDRAPATASAALVVAEPAPPSVAPPPPTDPLDLLPAAAPNLCGHAVLLTAPRRAGGRLHLGGVARPALAGRRVELRAGGTTIAHATVRADGSFSTVTEASGTHGRLRAVVAGERSPRVRVDRALELRRQRTVGDDRVRIVARLRGDARRVVVEQITGCAAEDVREVATTRVRQGGRIAVTVPRPAAGLAVHRLRTAGGAARSLPVVVRS